MLNMTLVDFFRMNQKAIRATMTTKTVVKLNKKSADKSQTNTLGTVYKIQKTVVGINEEYQKSVNQQRAVEGVTQDFVAASLPWGKRVAGTKCIIEHNGESYLQTILHGYVSRNVDYVDSEGNPVKYEDIKPFMPVVNKSKAEQRQGLEETVQVRTVKFSSIVDLVVKTDELVIKLTP